MDVVTLIFIAIGLSFDSFAVSVSCGLILKEINFRQAIRFSLPLAILQAIMPVIGWFAGKLVREYIIDIDHWVAFILLVIIGIKMIIESRKEAQNKNINPLNLWINLGLGFATSIDALIIGVSFALFEINIYLVVVIIGSITFLVAMLGVLFGKKTVYKFGKKMELSGGVLLILIGFKILIEQLFFS